MKKIDTETTMTLTITGSLINESMSKDEAMKRLTEAERTIEFLIVGGFVTREKAAQARALAKDFS